MDKNIIGKFFKEFKENDFDWNILKSPVELNKSIEDIYEDQYLFSRQAKFIYDLLKEFNDENHKPNKNLHITKTIGVIGGRGTGKTSFLRTFKNSIKSEGYFVFDIVDPNILGSSINILEILVSLIYGEINNYIDFENDDLIRKQTQLLRNLKEISVTLSNLRKKEGYFSENNPPVDVLSDMYTRINFNIKFKELLEDFKCFLNLKNSKNVEGIILMIDDLDLIKNKQVYEMLNDIQNFLSGNIILILSYRENQLLDSVLEQKMIENKILLESNQITSEDIKTQSFNMIEKLIPYNNRVNLKIENDSMYLNDLLNEIVFQNKSKLENFSNLKIEDFFEQSIMYKVNLPILPIDSKEYTNYIFPSNLRGKLQLFELIVKEMKNHDINTIPYNIYYNNLKIFESYFYSRMRNILSINKFNSIKNLINKPVDKKNFYVYKTLFDDFKQNLSNVTNKELISYKILDINKISSYNICLGDIHECLEIYKDLKCYSELDYYYIYCIKLTYSITLLEYLLDMLKNNNLETAKYNYLTLINVKIIPNSIEYSNINLKETFIMYYNDKIDITQSGTIWKIHYTDLTNSGNIIRETRPYISESHSISSHRYRQVFNCKDIASTIYNKGSLTKSWRYPTDPYAFLGKELYINDALREPNNKYIFYSFFDIDIFVRLTYSNVEDELYIKVLNKINSFISKDAIQQNIPMEEELKNKFYKNIFKEKNIDDYDNDLISTCEYEKPYNPDDLKEIINIMPNRNNITTRTKFNNIDEIFEIIDVNNLKSDSLNHTINNLNRANNLIGSRKFINREDLIYELELVFKDNNINNKNNILNITSTLNLIFNRTFKVNPFKEIIYSNGENNSKAPIDLGGKNNFIYIASMIIESENIKEFIFYLELKIYILSLIDIIDSSSTSTNVSSQKALAFIILTFNIRSFNSELYRYEG